MNIEKEVVVALITVGGGIVVAIINLISNRKKSPGKSERDIKISQQAKGKTITQVGIQINTGKGKEDEPSE